MSTIGDLNPFLTFSISDNTFHFFNRIFEHPGSSCEENIDCLVSKDGASYTGVLSTTESGNPCEPWNGRYGVIAIFFFSYTKLIDHFSLTLVIDYYSLNHYIFFRCKMWNLYYLCGIRLQLLLCFFDKCWVAGLLKN